MFANVKAMFVVLVLATAAFAVARPLCLRFMEVRDFSRRRDTWFVLTATAFLSPSFWLFVLVATILLLSTSRKERNPVALYLLLMQVVPPLIGAQLPTIGINKLFELDWYRTLSFVVLLPAAMRIAREPKHDTPGVVRWIDVSVLAYIGLELLLLVPYESFTNTLRRGFLSFIDVILLYFVVSRICTSRRAIAEALASFGLAWAVAAPLAVFESVKGWILYAGIGSQWSSELPGPYLFREGILRAQVTAGHPLQLGYAFAIAFGLWLYLSTRAGSKWVTIGGAICMWAGLLAAYSRGPWLAAIAIFFINAALGPKGGAQLAKAMLVSALLAGVIIASPIGGRVIDNLPFVGSVDAANVTYRLDLAQTSWAVIKEHPFFGSPFVLSQLEDLRQGQGIIDLVNSYAAVALFFGMAGLGLLLAPFLIGAVNVYRVVKQALPVDRDLSLLGGALVACMIGTLIMMGTAAFRLLLENMFYILMGLAAGYSQVNARREYVSADRAMAAKRPARAGTRLERGA